MNEKTTYIQYKNHLDWYTELCFLVKDFVPNSKGANNDSD